MIFIHWNQYFSFHNTTISIFVKSTEICIQKALSVLHKSIYLSSFKSWLFSFPISTPSLFVNKVAIALGYYQIKVWNAAENYSYFYVFIGGDKYKHNGNIVGCLFA